MTMQSRAARAAVSLCVMVVALAAGALGAQPATGPLQFSAPVSAPFVETKPVVANPFSEAARPVSPRAFSTEFPAEVEPNGTPATATPLGAATYVRMQGNLFPAADVDYFSFAAQAGDRIYAAVITAANTSTSADSQLNLLDTDGTTVLEFDDDDGSFAATSSSIAGTVIPADGTYYLSVNHFTAAQTLRPYELHVRIQRGSPTPEVESNDTPGTANPLPANGWVSGTRNPPAATEQDWYAFTANAGDTVFLSLDADPERDGVQWDGRLGIALFGDAANQILVVNDTSSGAGNPLSEALVFTIKTAGTYFAFVDSATAAVGGPTATYHLSVSVQPPPTPMPLAACTTYTSTDVPKTIGPANGLVSSLITVPGNPRIGDLNVEIQLNHALMADVDAHLRSPSGNDIGLFTDIGAAATGGQAQMDVVFDDEAAIPPTFTALRNMALKPELNYRLSWFDGENAGGTWTLDLRDDVNNASGGTLTSWSLRICEPPPPPTCGPGFVQTTVYSTDFESGAAGFTHSGTQDEWELGLPATVATTTANPVAAFNSCASGVNCWKTDLDNTYNISSNQNLTSPSINLGGFSPPIVVRWSHQYQMESASFDLYSVDLREVGGANPVRLFEWLDATMTDAVGNPTVNIPARAGWSQVVTRADALAGQNVELNFNLTSDNTVNFGGVAVDDVSVTACRVAIADLSITKTDGVTTAVPGGSVTYTITASNAGPDADTAATVADTFPAALTCTWTCVGAGGGTCTAAGSGNIADTVNLPSGGSVTYTASCAIGPSVTGTLSNTATVTASVADPNPANNSATDTDTLTPQADLAITKTDGVTSVIQGGSTTYTITASNAGPSNASGATVTDTFPASLTCTWTCVGAGGGTCTAAGSGNIADTVNLPAGGSTTHTASCGLSASATGTLSNTATVAAPAGVTDPTPGNNSATDTDTITLLGAAVTASKTVAGSFVPGSPVTYTVTLTNSLGAQANNPGDEFTDVLPAALTLVSATATSGSAVATIGTNTVTWNGAIPGGGSVTITITATLSPSATGTVANQGSFAYDGDANGSNETNGLTDDPAQPGAADPTVFTVGAAVADLAITKTDGVTTATPGGSTTYTIVASNAGPSAVTGATVTDTFPASLTCTWTCAGSGGGTCAPSGSGNIASPVTLPVGASATYTATCAISATASGTLVNTATIAVPAGVNDPTPGNNSATDTDTLAATADLAITKTDGVTSATPGDSTTYTIVASNAGPSAVTGATVTDTFAASLTCTWTCAGSGGGTCAPSGSGNIASPVTLPVGASATYTATCAISATASGTLVNTATIAAPAGVTDPTPGNNSATDTDALGAETALSISKTDGATTVAPGGTLTYTIVASNVGPSAAVGATVSDAFPAACVAPAWTCAASGGGNCPAGGSGAIAASVDLPAGAAATFTATCPVDPALADGTVITNTATVAEAAGATDPDPSDNSATDTTTAAVPVAGAAVSVRKSVSGSFLPGGAIRYTLVLVNSGGPQGDNPGDELTDVLPPQLVLVAASASSGAASANPATNTVTWNGAIPAGGSVTVLIDATIRSDASGTIGNQAGVAYDGDGDGSNEATALSDDPAVPGAADPTVFPVGAPAVVVPVPTLTGLGALLLGLGLAGLAIAARPRRRLR
ncbi:proprotein convertase P-domain-containing protein [Dokdonella koreensis]|uniref:Peptidase domain protein n=1 Tax=Dokdonella koreensis DS-123 TaxID=1300342 RepID=A0A160DXT0_9GAMM|nr:proprotein convertase P-domain-containing protein [Dokdonella koreensis]ANB19547.1 Peptidase domain protein [Dokdonella koreensis DS-123]